MEKFLIAGLGNIGEEYADTRHNVGFLIADALAASLFRSGDEKSKPSSASLFSPDRYASVNISKLRGRSLFIIKPTTYMNLSGKAVKYWMDKENIPLENILVITDDLNLSFGTIRIKPKGSDGGHNGLKNINLVLNTQNYTRYRFGISDQFKKGQQVDYVLGEWNAEEEAKLPERLETSAEIIKTFGTAGLENTMTTFNGK